MVRSSSWCHGLRRGTGRTLRNPSVDRLLSWHQGIRQGVLSFHRASSSIRGTWRIYENDYEFINICKIEIQIIIFYCKAIIILLCMHILLTGIRS